MRKLIVYLALACIFFAIGGLFYQQEVKYWIPTPVPEDYVSVATGSFVSSAYFKTGDKKFIHFFNPTCPCSKFNLQSYKELINQYGEEFTCYAVVQKSLKGVRSQDIDYLRKLKVNLIIDQEKQLAKSLGVYATPQVVLLDEKNQLYYRGNYNLARYCTNPRTNYAKMAIDAFLNDSIVQLPQTAFTAYGCSLERHTH